MTIISYAQNFEDVRLWRALGAIDQGRYIDVGAYDAEVDSVSLAFYQRGWRGIHVEPVPDLAVAIAAARPDEKVIQAAVAKQSTPMKLYWFPKTGLSSGVTKIAQRHIANGHEANEITVECISLASLLDEMGDGPIHWLKIDAEGMEKDILESWGTHPQRPWVLIVESTFPNTQTRSDAQWVDLVTARGYRNVHFDGLSCYFVAEGRDDLIGPLSLDSNIFDGFQITHRHFSAGLLHSQSVEKIARLQAESDCASKASSEDVARLEQAREEHDKFRRIWICGQEQEALLRAEMTGMEHQIARLSVDLEQLKARADEENRTARAEIAATRRRAYESETDAERLHVELMERVKHGRRLIDHLRSEHAGLMASAAAQSERQDLARLDHIATLDRHVERLRETDQNNRDLIEKLRAELEGAGRKAQSAEAARIEIASGLDAAIAEAAHLQIKRDLDLHQLHERLHDVESQCEKLQHERTAMQTIANKVRDDLIAECNARETAEAMAAQLKGQLERDEQAARSQLAHQRILEQEVALLREQVRRASVENRQALEQARVVHEAHTAVTDSRNVTDKALLLDRITLLERAGSDRGHGVPAESYGNVASLHSPALVAGTRFGLTVEQILELNQ